MDPVAKTAYYCCGIRARDAESARPICGDGHAKLFMTAEGRDIFNRFSDLSKANASNATRARIIDDLLRARLAINPKQQIVLLGAGFDSRAFRLTGGRWAELDHPEVMAIKTRVLPQHQCPNELERIGIDFARDRLGEKLSRFNGERDAVVVLEGVSMYLSEEQLRGTLAVLRELLPRHTLICDLQTIEFGKRYAQEIRERIAEFGGKLGPFIAEPASTIADMGYRELSRQSIIGRARELGAIRVPGFVFNTFLRGLRDGYRVYCFESL